MPPATTRPTVPPYRETTSEIELADVSAVTMQTNPLDWTYTTRHGTRTIRSRKCGSAGGISDDVPDEAVPFWHDGTKYAFHLEDRCLLSVGRTTETRTVASRAEIRRVETVSYPTSAPVEGAVSDGVEATIYYRSPRSDAMQTVTVDVTLVEGRGGRLSGEDVDGDRRIEAETRWERKVTSKHGTTERPLGRTARVEFPRGQRFVVDVEGLGDRGVDRVREKLGRAAGSAVAEGEVSVTHEGRLTWDT